MARWPKEYREVANRERRNLFVLEIDRKYTIPGNKGGRSHIIGVCTPEQWPALHFAYRVMHGADIQDALKLLHIELAELETTHG